MTRTGGWPDRSSMVVAEEPEGDNINVTATSSSGSNRSWREWREVTRYSTQYCPIPLTVIFLQICNSKFFRL